MNAYPAGTSRARETVQPLTPELRRLNVTVSAEFMAELAQVRDALSHQVPDGAFEKVVREAFRLVLERDRKRKALTDHPRAPRAAGAAAAALKSRPADDARYVPAAIKRTVWKCDGGKCTWPMGDGRPCASTRQLQFDHDLEVALGGRATVDNIRLLCRTHNLMKAEMRLGREVMGPFRKFGAQASMET